MSLSIVNSRALLGLEARPVCVEVHLANGLPSFTLVGLAETEVKEARERVRSAIQNTGLEFPGNKRITVNLAPADLPKDSGRFDLAIALGILAASASYIAVPAAMRLALPQADPGIYLSMSLGVTFPFNIIFGISIFAALAQALG